MAFIVTNVSTFSADWPIASFPGEPGNEARLTDVHDVVTLRVVSKPVIEQSKFRTAEGHRVWLRGGGFMTAEQGG